MGEEKKAFSVLEWNRARTSPRSCSARAMEWGPWRILPHGFRAKDTGEGLGSGRSA